MNKNYLINRRSFLKVAGTTTGGLMVGLNLTSAQATPKNLTFEPNAFLKINADNTITFVLTRLDMGQGLTTGLAMIACESNTEIGALLSFISVTNIRVTEYPCLSTKPFCQLL